MNGSFRPVSGETPDEIDLELLEAGALDDPEVQARVRAAAAGALRQEAEDLAEARRAWSASRRPLLPQAVDANPAAPEAEAVGGPPRAGRGRRVRSLALWAGLAAAAALAVVALRGGPPAPTDPEPALRRMGAALPIAVTRAGAADGPWREGDTLSLAVGVDVAGELVVATLQEDGAVAIHDTAPVEAGSRYATPGALALDGYAGREWVVVLVAPEGLSVAAREEAVRALLPDPASACQGSCGALDVTRARAE